METLNHAGVGWRGRRMDRPHPKGEVIGQTLGTDLSVCSSSTCLPVFLFLLRTFSYFFFSLSVLPLQIKKNSVCLLNWVRLKLQLSYSHPVLDHTLRVPTVCGHFLDREGCKPSRLIPAVLIASHPWAARRESGLFLLWLTGLAAPVLIWSGGTAPV